jgi:FkbM family methyltransferase
VLNKLIKNITPDFIDISEGKIYFNKADPVMTAWTTMGSFEPGTVKFFREAIREGMNIIDIGANIGYYTVIASKRVGQSGKVFSYEPDPENFRFLEDNIKKNNLENTIPLMTALSDTISERKLYLGNNKCTTHAFTDNSGTGKSELVNTDTLDHSLIQYGSPIIDIIKIDIEGAEILALEGMKETINRSPNLIMFTELYPKAMRRLNRNPVEYLERLQRFGFTLFLIDENKQNLDTINDINKFILTFRDDESVENIYAVKKH